MREKTSLSPVDKFVHVHVAWPILKKKKKIHDNITGEHRSKVQSTNNKPLRNGPLEKIAEKGENAANQIFSFCHNVFFPI